MFTRRTATVTISAPDASTAAAFCSKSLVFAGADDQPRGEGPAGDGPGVGHAQPPPDEGDDLELVAILDR